MKKELPLVSGPLFAIDNNPGLSWENSKDSSAKYLLYIEIVPYIKKYLFFQ